MTAADMSTITASGVLALAAATSLGGAGVDVPMWIPAVVPLVVGAVLLGLRAYIAVVGAEKTRVDEALESALAIIEAARKAARK